MRTEIIRERQDLTWLRWSHIRSSGGTAGTLLKSESVLNGRKINYKGIRPSACFVCGSGESLFICFPV